MLQKSKWEIYSVGVNGKWKMRPVLLLLLLLLLLLSSFSPVLEWVAISFSNA